MIFDFRFQIEGIRTREIPRSTSALSRQSKITNRKSIKRPARIELAIPPWQGDGLPLHHGRLLLAQPNCQRSVKFEVRKVKCENFKLRTSQFKLLIVGSVGIEPTSAGLRVRCITLSATIPFVFCLPSRRGRNRTSGTDVLVGRFVL